MESYILSSGVLNDNTLHIAENGKVFKGGYIAFIKEYRFSNAWSNSEHIKRFKRKDTLNKYIANNYPEFEFYI